MSDPNPNLPSDPHDPELDAMLRGYLNATLDGQLGRAAAHFHRHLGGGSTGTGAGAPPRTRRHHYNPGGGWVIGIVGSALAASIAALWAGPSLRLYTPRPEPAPPAVTVVSASNEPSPLEMDELTLCSQTRDGGTVVLDGQTAARRVIRRELKQTRWTDPKTGASLEIIEPRQDIMLIQLQTY